jgi:hypothetical protein
MADRLPRKNDPASIEARREALGLDGDVDLTAYTQAAESVTGTAVIPVSVAQLPVSLGAYILDDDGDVVETGRAEETVTVPLAHTEGGLTASVQRGAKAAELSGGFRTYVVADRITRASCFVCKDAGDALILARWIGDHVDEMRDWLRNADVAELSSYAVLREAKTHVVGPLCHVLWRFTTGDAVGANMMTATRAEHGVRRPERPCADRALAARGEHGRRQEAVVRVLPVGPRQDRDRAERRSAMRQSSACFDDGGPARRSLLGRHAGRGRIRMQSTRSPGVGDRRDSRPRGRTSAWSGQLDGARHRPTGRGGLHAAIRFPASRSARSAAARATVRASVARLMGCAGPGKVYRLAQITPRACSRDRASAAMATAGSGFFRAHFSAAAKLNYRSLV